MNRNSNYQWYFSNRNGLAIQLHHQNMYLWIGVDPKTRDIRTIGVYDIQDVEMHVHIGYVVNFFEPDGIFYGEVRPLVESGDSIVDAHYTKFEWMSLLDKETMLDLMRKAVSYRSTPLPPKFKKVWDEAKKIVNELDIINPGQQRYIG